MEQQKALNALEPFLALTKSASSPLAAADLITRATSHANTFIFSELLQAPQIQALGSSADHGGFLTLLKIFSYGTYQDYRNTAGLPKLNEQQTLKLRQLSLLSLAKTPSALTYQNLLEALSLETTRELEDLVISAIYAGLVSGTLDPYHQFVSVSSVAPLRDLPPNSIPSMLSTLSAWSNRCVSTLQDLESQILRIKAEALQRHKEEAEWEAHVEELIKEKSADKGKKEDGGMGLSMGSNTGRRLGQGAAMKRGNGAMGGGSGSDEDVDMEADEEDEEEGGGRRGSNKKNRGFGKMSFGK
ncbi:hypothetical protein BP5796_03401 [Coleophoma crateriformis]|uniref:PCI domain-containing protein n=1 Tax=Coleophoma crateriformis TaxID=565419 RepID=A0A3D8SN15_9HELO|nr:hypothetical protein BP5796_03401 [Coleophoma crateriformis]